MKQYEFRVVVREGNDEFWESVDNKSGCDDVTDIIKDILYNSGLDCEVLLTNFTDDGSIGFGMTRSKVEAILDQE